MLEHFGTTEFTTILGPNTEGITDSRSETFNCNLLKFITDGIVVLTIFVVGLICNTLAIVVFWPKRKMNSTSFLLIVLAFLDVGVVGTYMINVTISAFCLYFKTCSFYMRYIWVLTTTYLWPVSSALHLASTWQVTLVMFHRYMAACHPHKYTSWTSMAHTRIQIISILVCSMTYNIPRFVDILAKPSPDGSRFIFVATALGKSKIYGYVYDVGLYYIIIYVVPFTALTYMTIRLMRVLQKSRKTHQIMTKAKKEENDLTFTLVIVVLVYMVCQIMNPIRRGLSMGLPAEDLACGKPYSFVSFMTTMGIVLNSSCNFFIYCLCGKGFRRSLLKTLHFGRNNTVSDLPLASASPRKTGSTPVSFGNQVLMEQRA